MCECGRPKSECRNPANAGLYEVESVTCQAQAAVEEHTGQKGFTAEPGQLFYASEIDADLIARRPFPPLPDANERDDKAGEPD